LSKLVIFEIDELIAFLLDNKDIETFQFLSEMLSISSTVALSIQKILETQADFNKSCLLNNNLLLFIVFKHLYDF